MPYIAQTRDLTKQYLSYGRILSDYRPVGNTLYRPGTVVQLVAMDQQVYNDEGTVAPVPISGFQGLIVGAIAESWPGFSGVNNAIPQPNTPPSFLSPSTDPNERGTAGVLCVVQGYHPSVSVDNSVGAAITDGGFLIPSTVTPGYAEGGSALPAVGMGLIGLAMLPATGPLSSLGVGTLAQAVGTITFTGQPAGSTWTVTITIPNAAPLVLTNFSQNSLTGANTAAAFAALLAGNPYFSVAVATNVITLTATGNSYIATAGGSSFPINFTGAVANGSVISATVTSGTVPTIVQPTGGVGYFGTVPAFITGALC